MATLAYVVHGHGRGHASRALLAQSALERMGHRVALFAGEDARSLLPRATPVRSVVPGRRMPQQTLVEARSRRRAFEALGPDLVITDGDTPAALAAKQLSMPTIAMGHGLVFRYCRLPRRNARHRRAAAIECASASGAAVFSRRQIVVHFAPIVPLRASVRVVRPEAARPFGESPALKSAPFVLAYFGDRRCRARALRVLASMNRRVVYFGAEPPETSSSRIEWRRPDRADFARHLAACEGVVASAGSQLISECILARKAIVATYMPSAREQSLNGWLLERAGLGTAVSIDELDSEHIVFGLRRPPPESARVALSELPTVSEALAESVDELLRPGAGPEWLDS